ncbi:hypothetical protein DLD77_07705 [Chitinophaga alhagiae]|uniref:DUF3575 domain-containing protein n=1 Tax=Chitinophaga alhagiae TaxID=2203219 RepID=A0ABM6WCJ4_9BACT|nr:hypothetical protein [Chitinophaga alhagiae]AWO01587.1 hypothetical protein DLD77_07705 [Chitinophaga alhagiae]
MKQLITLSLLMLLALPLAAQKFYEHDYKNNINLSLFSLVSDNPGFELGYERKYGRWSTLATYTILSDALARPSFIADTDTTYFKNYGGYRFSFEQRYFLRKRKVLMPYAGIFTSWLKSEYSRSERFGRGEGYIDTFSVNKATWVLSPRFGLQFHFNRLLLDVGTGVGIKWRQVSHTGREDPSDRPSNSLLYIFFPLPRETVEDKGLTISIPLNVRVAFQF